MKKYELMLILNPELKDKDREDLINEIKKELEGISANITKEDVWWNKDLAYKINGSLNWYYILFEIESDGNFDSLTKYFNIKKDVWRNLLTKIED